MAWPAWRLWLEGHVQMTELAQMSIDDVDLANEALDAYVAAAPPSKGTK